MGEITIQDEMLTVLEVIECEAEVCPICSQRPHHEECALSGILARARTCKAHGWPAGGTGEPDEEEA